MNNILQTIDDRVLIFCGIALLMAVLWFFKWLIQRQLNAQFDRMAAVSLEGKKEREYDQYLALRGQQVTNDCLHELIYAVLNGTHNGSLEKANKELEVYRGIMDENLAKKAARWTIKIQK